MKLIRKRIEKQDIIIFLISAVVLFIAWTGFAPALMTSDNWDQVASAYNNIYLNAHPIFHTWLIGNIAKLFNGGVGAVAIFQIIVFSLVWTWGCKVARRENDKKLNKLIQIIITILVVILPINFIYSITLWKDILYSYAMLCVLVCIYVGIKNKFKFSIGEIILISLSSVCIMKFRHNGVPIGIFIFVLLFITNLIREKKIKFSATFIVSFVIIYCVTSIPAWTYLKQSSIENASGALSSTKIYCIAALLNTDLEFDQEDLEFLDSAFDVDEWKSLYNTQSNTAIIFNDKFNKQLTNSEEGNKKLTEIFWKYAKQRPFAIAKHFAALNAVWWMVPEQIPIFTLITDNDAIYNYEQYLNLGFETKPISEGVNNALTNYTNAFMNNRVLYTVFIRPAMSFWVATVLIIVLAIRKKDWHYLYMGLPMILNIGTYVILMASQETRYFYPCHLTTYFMLIVFAANYGKAKYSIKKEEKTKAGNKTLVIVPAYNEEGSIKKVVESVYAENITNLDVLVVNDGSKDNTYNEAKKTKATVLNLPNNLGIGGAVQTGYLYAYKNDYDIAVQIDGDGQHDPKYLKQMIEILEKGEADMVIGSRFCEKTKYKQTFFRMLGINITSGLINLFTDHKVYDTTSGYRASNRGIIENFARSYPYDYPEPITTMQMILKNKIVKEIPVEMRQRTTGVSSISPLKSVSYMIKVTISLILNGFREN